MRKSLVHYGLGVALLLVLFLVLFTASGCGRTDRGMLQIYITDQPLGVDAVWVTLSAIQVHRTGENWVTLSIDEKEVNLLAVANDPMLLVEQPLAEGFYQGFRLSVTKARIEANDTQMDCDVIVPGDRIQVPLVFEVEADAVTQVLLDFDVKQSVQVVQAGPSMQCIVRPVILAQLV